MNELNPFESLSSEPVNSQSDQTPGQKNESGSENWLPLMDFAIKNGISLSTLRRHIKAGKIKHKTENGKYLIWDEAQSVQTETQSQFSLQQELQKAKEEIAELKTLIAFYEEQISPLHPNN